MAPNQVESKGETQILQTRRRPGIYSKKKSVPYLNHDIMRSIFMRVPTISLFHNCMFLSKQCSKFICNQNFMKAHFLQSKPGILLIEKRKDNGQVFKFMELKETQVVKLHNLHISNEKLSICANSGGLSILFYHPSGDSHVVNLVTKESIQLPALKENDFGENIVFDRANMNYKIVYFSWNHTNERNCKSEITITLLELDGSCKRIKGPELPTLSMPVLVNGVLYCRANKNGLFCLDLSTETFSYLGWPIDINSAKLYQIMDLGGFLGFVAVDTSEEINIWTLREEKWVHRCCVNKGQTLPGETWRIPRFLGCLGIDEDLFLFTRDLSRLDAYNLKTKQWIMIKPTDNTHCDGIHETTIIPLTSNMVS